MAHSSCALYINQERDRTELSQRVCLMFFFLEVYIYKYLRRSFNFGRKQTNQATIIKSVPWALKCSLNLLNSVSGPICLGDFGFLTWCIPISQKVLSNTITHTFFFNWNRKIVFERDVHVCCNPRPFRMRTKIQYSRSFNSKLQRYFRDFSKTSKNLDESSKFWI